MLKPWIIAAAAGCFLVQFLVTIVTLLLTAQGTVSGTVLGIVLFNWLPVLFAGCALPMGLLLTRQQLSAPQLAPSQRWVETSVATVVIIFWSFGIFIVFGAFFEMSVPDWLRELVDDPAALAVFIPIALLAAVIEEVIFRMGLQGGMEHWLRRWKLPVWPAVVVASLVWALGHAGMVSPLGTKELQIFVIGLVLGWLKIRHGAAACIGAHFGLNLTAIVMELLFDWQLF